MLDKGRIVMSGLNVAVRETHPFPLCPIAVDDGIFVRAICMHGRCGVRVKVFRIGNRVLEEF